MTDMHLTRTQFVSKKLKSWYCSPCITLTNYFLEQTQFLAFYFFGTFLFLSKKEPQLSVGIHLSLSSLSFVKPSKMQSKLQNQAGIPPTGLEKRSP